jgi:hypothetical protein
MDVVNHGGKCCGIKIIHGFHELDWSLDEVSERQEPREFTNHGVWEYSRPGENFFHGAAPVESTVARFYRLVGYCKEKRPAGLIEIALVTEQLKTWRETIEDEGFVEAVSFKNSNSGKTIHVFHLVYG